MGHRDERGSGLRSGETVRRSRARLKIDRAGFRLGAIAILLVLALGCAHHGHGHGAHHGHAAEDGDPSARAARRAEHAARHAALDRLVAIEDIRQLKARFMRCVDTKDLVCLRDEVFAPGGEVYFKGGDYEIRAVGWTAIEKFYQDAFSTKKFGMHTAHTPEITVEGETARGIWYLHDVFVNLEEGWTLQGSALYHDDYAKLDGQWRIVFTTYERLFEETTPRDPRTKLGSKSVKE
ncbi:MAG: nuclear transport factor 2 family protein [Deltaproteobacteria bacterium]|nr:nuclear transport factor 2 family protein [Deltaproteobacteria bacterium]